MPQDKSKAKKEFTKRNWRDCEYDFLRGIISEYNIQRKPVHDKNTAIRVTFIEKVIHSHYRDQGWELRSDEMIRKKIKELILNPELKEEERLWKTVELELLESVVQGVIDRNGWFKLAVSTYQTQAALMGLPERTERTLNHQMIQLGYHARKWSTDEENFLSKLATRYQYEQLVPIFQKHAAEQKWPFRGKYAIHKRMSKRKLHKEDREDQFSISELARQLDIKHARVKRWYRECDPPLETVNIPYANGNKGGHRVVTTKRSVRKFLTTPPKHKQKKDDRPHRLHLVADLPEEVLEWIFVNDTESIKLALASSRVSVQADVLKIHPRTKRVVERYKNQKRAADANGIDIQRMRTYINGPLALEGFFWKTEERASLSNDSLKRLRQPMVPAARRY